MGNHPTTRSRAYREGWLGRRRTYKCHTLGCPNKFQVDTRNPLPLKDRFCPECKGKHTLISLPAGITAFALPDGRVYHLRADCPLLEGGIGHYNQIKSREVKAKELMPCALCAYTDYDPRRPFSHGRNPSGLDDIDWGVILRWGIYFRPDIGVYLNDLDYWRYKEHEEAQ
jgi:hypothetical protein